VETKLLATEEERVQHKALKKQAIIHNREKVSSFLTEDTNSFHFDVLL
jgi:3-methyladenine DNA glycosylase Tag